jgi:hypothetical protein
MTCTVKFLGEALMSWIKLNYSLENNQSQEVFVNLAEIKHFTALIDQFGAIRTALTFDRDHTIVLMEEPKKILAMIEAAEAEETRSSE